MRDRQSGFTLIETMVTLAVIAILASIALPSFFGESRKNRAQAEVQPMFNDLRIRLEQYLQEHGQYPPTIGEATMWPTAAPNTTPRAINPLPTTWQDIKVRISGHDQVVCGYTWSTGLANDGSNIGGVASAGPPAGFGFATPPATDWYYLLAKCDMNNNGVYSYYFSSSVDPTVLKVREGD